ncbi:DedA family protein [Mangrovihabitans endophyticus]|uniref:Membrane protein n=1 Tax=Mangrovihabitans endophyticus TaxID=1751298 RepID=A0A8J3FQQ7_9ACTN|nr:DedA family protein [Mangrovihabitans endophyticus]GGL09145.1 membrane protein [Mangrovihabitans endophyticus]
MHDLGSLAGTPWVLVIVFLVSGLDAVLPFMPSESTVVAVGVITASTGRPLPAALIGAAAAGAFGGDCLSYEIGRRSNRTVLRRARRAHDWAHRLLHRRGGLVIMFARYVPGGRSTTAFAAGAVGYPAGRFRRYTAAGVLLWAVEAALLGFSGGAVFADRPILGLLTGWAGALAVTGIALLVQRLLDRRESASQPRRAAVRSASATPVSFGPSNTGSRPDSVS